MPGFIPRDETVAEMIIRPTGEREFAIRGTDGSVTTDAEFVSGGVVFRPIAGTLAGSIVSFAGGLAQYGSPTKLLTDVRAFIHRYVDLSADYEVIAAL